MPTTFRIYGKKQTAPATGGDDNEFLILEEAYEISSSRSENEMETVKLEDDRFVEVVFSDNTTWFGDSNSLKDIFPELKKQTRSAAEAPVLPGTLVSDDASRSLVGDIALRIVRKFIKKEIKNGIRSVASDIETRGLKDATGKVGEGLYTVTPAFGLVRYKQPPVQKDNGKNTLLFIHGTSSSTFGAFSGLKGSKVWEEIVNNYGDNILGFEHRTLTVSPIKNVYELVEALPANTSFDVVTHSRGGLVGELLMRFCESETGFMEQSLQLLKDEGRKEEIAWIEAACKTAATKKIKVGRFVRVACTARGTSLLSERTDIFLNTLINLIQVSGPILTPLVGGLKMLITETVDSKNSFKELPGLEAQRPDSVIIKALNTYKEFDANENPVGFANRLTVISGNGKLSLSLNGLKILLTKFFFRWKENDLVVDTASMYQGAKRARPVQYYLDYNPNTNHFNYFVNEVTRDALKQALFASGIIIPTFKEVQGDNFDAAANRGIFGLENGRLKPVYPSGSKPIVLLLPGIMGSFLEQGSKSVWINYLRFATGGLLRLEVKDDDNINATGVIKTAYSDLVEYLSSEYDVMVVPFDWRRPLVDAGKNLAALVTELKNKFAVTVSLVGHSMGGLVIRDLIINHTGVWDQLNTQAGFRTVLLGTPWLGSYRIPHVLSGKDSIIKQLDGIDFTHSKRTLINMFSKFPGLLDLLPIHDNRDFGSVKVWDDFVNAAGLDTETIPAALLKQFSEYTKLVKTRIDAVDYRNIIYVAGKDKETISDYSIENGSLKFTATAEGDQSVTWASGIPAKIDRDKALYYTRATHGGLSQKDFLFPGINELLKTGATTSPEFSRTPMPVAGSERSFSSKEQFEFEATESSIETNILGLAAETAPEETNTPILNLYVSNGDLMFARYPVLIGHFANDDIYNAEDVANTYLKKALWYKHKLGLYPGAIGTNEFFPSHDKSNDFPGCIIVGLGLSETINAYQLTQTIEKAVSDYLLTHCKNGLNRQADGQSGKFGLSSLLIGAGYAGMAIETAIRAIMQGVINANENVMTLTGLQWLYISELEFVELYEDRSIQCFTGINALMQGNNDGMTIGWAEKNICKNFGIRKRLLTETANEWWQRLCVLKEKDDDTDAGNRNKVTRLLFYSSTNSAREEKQELSTSLKPLESIIEDISTKKNWAYEKARSLFELLIPSYFKETIKRNAPIMWVLDDYTAAFPWELLQTGNQKEKPLCISAQMIRQLSTDKFDPVNPVKTNNAIIIGDPDLDGFDKARQLPGAAQEAQEVYDLIRTRGRNVKVEDPQIRVSSSQIFINLYKQDYKIIHIAAHGFFDKNNSGNTGILIGKDKDTGDPVFLTPAHIAQLPGTPELVFINCCFLGKINPYAEEYSANRHKLAANIGTQLIRKGVKAVVVAGWEVDDAAARAFAIRFYEEMLEGAFFGEAVHRARKEIYTNFGYTNTWGAFQCYGQPQYRLDGKGWVPGRTEFDIPQQAENKLENIISKSEVAFYKQADLLGQLQQVSQAIRRSGFKLPALTQLEANAYLELNDYETSHATFNELFKYEHADYKVTSLETFQLVSFKRVMQEFYAAQAAGNITDLLIETKAEEIEKTIANIKTLLLVWETAQRYSLIASACKRKAYILKHNSRKATAEKQMRAALEEAAMYYYSGYRVLKNSYNFSNWLALRILLGTPAKGWKEKYCYRKGNRSATATVAMSLTEINKMLKELEQQPQKKAMETFWDLSSEIDLHMCHFLLKTPGKKREESLDHIADGYKKLWTKIASVNKRERQKESIDLLIAFARFTGKASIVKDLDLLKQKKLGDIW